MFHPKTCNQLDSSVTIDSSNAAYKGTYTTSNHPADETYSYYLNGDSSRTDVPHFTLASDGGKGTFTSFHVTVYADGANAAVWYNATPQGGIARSNNINFKNMPPSRQGSVTAQLGVIDGMAQQFWDQLN